MGRLNLDEQIQHISHPHPLCLANINADLQRQQQQQQQQCAGCKKEASGLVYTCRPCNFLLHKACSQMPTQITHPFDHQNQHVLSLLATPIYPEGLFNCDACGKPGDGFSYHCSLCGIDLHAACASKPLSLPPHPMHPHHQLCLSFSPPFNYNNVFSCDICGNPGSHQWLYRCVLCGFDAHLECATAKPTTTTTATATATATGATMRSAALANYRSVPANFGRPAGTHIRPTTSANGTDQLLNQLAQGLFGFGGGAAAAGGNGDASQILIQGLLGLPFGFGGGNGSGGDAGGGDFTVIDDNLGGLNFDDFN